MKKSINIWSALTIAAALTAGFTACSNEDNILEEQQQDAQAQVYHFSIPASFDAGTNRATGIGSGAFGSCGTITISGGQIGGKIGGSSYDGAVGSQYAAGIGSGESGSCGTITIGADITYVRVSSNSDSYHLIGGEGPNSCAILLPLLTCIRSTFYSNTSEDKL